MARRGYDFEDVERMGTLPKRGGGGRRHRELAGSPVIEFKAAYNRTGRISVGRGPCDACGRHKMLILIDPSEGEYGYGGICLSCIGELFSLVI
jgi:hypothetical protein